MTKISDVVWSVVSLAVLIGFFAGFFLLSGLLVAHGWPAVVIVSTVLASLVVLLICGMAWLFVRIHAPRRP